MVRATFAQWVVGTPLKVLVVVVLAVVLRWLIHRAIGTAMRAAVRRHEDRLARPGHHTRLVGVATGAAPNRQIARMETLASVLRSVTTLTVYGIATVTVMAVCGLPVGPLLASAGVGGIAVGFGAQSLVRDYLSGVFMILEDQYGVGDLIDAGVATGTVEEVSLRVTRLRDADGVLWYVRHGEIQRIGNTSQGRPPGGSGHDEPEGAGREPETP